MNKLLLLICPFLTFIFHNEMEAQNKPDRATYYSNKLHGNKMASGTRYHKDSMYCAHMTYPLGTVLRVTNKTNGKSVVVRVEDRGPYSKRHTIDLSYAAAKQIGIIQTGHAEVSITPVKDVHVPYKFDDTVQETIDYETADIIPTEIPLWLFSAETTVPSGVDDKHPSVIEKKAAKVDSTHADKKHEPTTTSANEKTNRKK